MKASKQKRTKLARALDEPCPTCGQTHSQGWLAELVGRSAITVSRWVRGERPVPVELRPVIAKALGRDESDLFEKGE